MRCMEGTCIQITRYVFLRALCLNIRKTNLRVIKTVDFTLPTYRSSWLWISTNMLNAFCLCAFRYVVCVVGSNIADVFVLGIGFVVEG